MKELKDRRHIPVKSNLKYKEIINESQEFYNSLKTNLAALEKICCCCGGGKFL